jgi:two-component system response regulator RegA
MMEKILVIDDDEAFCRTLSRSLERHSLQVFAAHSAEEALASVKEHQQDKAVLDLRLGDDSGIQLIRPLLEIAPGMRIVVLTGFASLTTAVQAIKLGAINYLAKPVNVQSILKAFEEDASEEADEETADFAPTPLKQLEWEHIQRVLDENDGNISSTARQLGMHRRTLQRKLQKRPKLK